MTIPDDLAPHDEVSFQRRADPSPLFGLIAGIVRYDKDNRYLRIWIIPDHRPSPAITVKEDDLIKLEITRRFDE